MTCKSVTIAAVVVAIAFLLAIQDWGRHLVLVGVTRPDRRAESAVPHSVDEALVVARSQAQRLKSAEPFWKMGERFPDEPALYAGFLRYSTLYGQVLKPSHANRKTYPAEVRRIEQAIAAGKRLEPDNASFDFFEAALLFNRGQDSEALAALHRAAGKSHFNDHDQDELTAVIRDHERMIPRWIDRLHPDGKLAIYGVYTFPQYIGFRNVAKQAGEQAERAAGAGDYDTAVRIMTDLVRTGGLLRDSSTYTMGVMTGAAVQNIGVRAVYQGLKGDAQSSEASSVERLSSLRALIPARLSAGRWQALEDSMARSDEFRRRLKCYVRSFTWLETYIIAAMLLVSSWVCLIAAACAGVMGGVAWVWLGRRGRRGLSALGPSRLSVWMLVIVPMIVLLVVMLVGGMMETSNDVNPGLVLLVLLIVPFVVIPAVAMARLRIAPEIGRWDTLLSRLRTAASHAVPGLVALYFLASAVWIPFALRASSDLDRVIANEAELVWKCPLPPK